MHEPGMGPSKRAVTAAAHARRISWPAEVGKVIGAGLLLLVAGLLLWAWYGLASGRAALEARRLQFLHKVIIAEQVFRDEDRDGDGVRNFGTLDQLIQAGLISEQERQDVGIADAGPARSDPTGRWWAVADPMHPPQGRAFFVNQSGVIYCHEYPLRSKVDEVTADPPADAKVFRE